MLLLFHDVSLRSLKLSKWCASTQVVRALASAEEAGGRQLAPQVAEQVYVLELATAQMATLASAAEACAPVLFAG